MKWPRIIIYSIIIMLILELLKTFVSRQTPAPSYFLAVIISCIQVIFCLAVIFFSLSFSLIEKFFRFPFFTVVIWFTVFISLMECLFVYWYRNPHRMPESLKESYGFYYDFFDASFIQYERSKAVYDPDLFYKLKPSVKFTFSNCEFSTSFVTNHQGLRDDPISLSAPEIILIGDSYVMGWGVEEYEAFPALLEKRTNKNTLNAGIASYGTARQLMLLSKLDSSNLRFLIIQYCANDYTENVEFIKNDFKLPISPQKQYEKVIASYEWTRKYFPGKVFLVTIQAFLKSKINQILPVFAVASERKNDNGDELENALNFAEILYRSTIDFKKVKVIITRLNAYNFMSNSFIHQLKKISNRPPYYERFGKYISIVDLLPVLDKIDYYDLDVHLRPSGHRKVAEALFESLKTTH